MVQYNRGGNFDIGKASDVRIPDECEVMILLVDGGGRGFADTDPVGIVLELF